MGIRKAEKLPVPKQGMNMIEEKRIRSILEQYEVYEVSIDDFFDTSHGDGDIRYNYVINQKYVLKINSSDVLTETFLQGIAQLAEHYRTIGVWCPRLQKTKDGHFLYSFMDNNCTYFCYIEEYAFGKAQSGKGWRIAGDDIDFYELKTEMLAHVGRLAANYTGKNMVEHRSMWSIIDLAPYDAGMDEKQENLNELVLALRRHGYEVLAEKIEKQNTECRVNIKKYFDKLPRCVYQGDLNPTNLLVDEKQHFVGLIDFNMYGTEVNVNCFLNESMYFLREIDFLELTAAEIVEKMNRIQKRLLSVILEHYTFNEAEEKVYAEYKKVIDLSFFPNVMLWIELLEKKEYEDKVLALLELLCE